MKKIWPIIYVTVIPVVIFSGYRDLGVEDTNADWIFVSVTFGTFALFPVAMVACSLWYTKKDSMRRPSWDRHPIGWRTDTLQPLRVFLVLMASYTLGSAMPLPQKSEQGVMMFFFYLAGTAGLFVGERLVYLVYRDKIHA